jgi:hypothetical protein
MCVAVIDVREEIVFVFLRTSYSEDISYKEPT